MVLEIVRFVFYSLLIVIISKFILVEALRKLAESLKLKAKIVGNIAGYATSMPELLTVTTSSIRGLSGVSIYNIISSNVINMIQYISAVLFNKNIKKLNNTAIKTDIVIVILTIIIPIVILRLHIRMDISIIPLFVFMYVGCRLLNNSVHKIYLEKRTEEEKNSCNLYLKDAIINTVILFITGVILFLTSELLGNTLEQLCGLFNVPQIIVGVLLGFITSIPELITFFESQKYHKKNSDEMSGIVEATNNLLTSNIVNLFAIQAIGILIAQM